MNSVDVFEKYAQEYDEWFNVNIYVYKSEIRALKNFVPENGRGLEVGVGTGRFAAPLGIKIGVEPAKTMADIARKRGIKVYEARAEELPFDDSSFDFILIVVTICFVQDPIKVIREAERVLKPRGYIIIGIIDKESFLGRLYELKKRESIFYRVAEFYSVREVLNWLMELGFENVKTCQTIFKDPKEITGIEPVREGYGDGGFVVISAQKKKREI